MNTKAENNDTIYKIKMDYNTINFFKSILFGFMIGIIPLLLNERGSISFKVTIPFYIIIVIAVLFILLQGKWGIFSLFFSFCIYGIALKLSYKELLINIGTNMLQVVLLYLFIMNRRKSDRKVQKEIVFNDYLLLIIGVVYFVLSIKNGAKADFIWMIVMFCGVLGILYLVMSLVEKSFMKFWYMLLIAFVPALISNLFSAVGNQITWDSIVVYLVNWTGSNFILLMTYGFFIYKLLLNRNLIYSDKKQIEIKVSTICYYIATLFWNVLIIYLFYNNLLGIYAYIYFFPWVLGNVFFVLNLQFSEKEEEPDVDEKFSWHEKRILVVENNTQMLIAIITFLLPISSAIIGTVTEVMLGFMVANIFCACMSIGLIWVPKSNLGFIELLKCIKTIFHLYTIALLLLNVIFVFFPVG